MPEGEAHVKVTATGLRQLARGFDRVDRSVGKVGRTGSRVGRILNRNISGLAGKVGGLRTAFAGLGAAMKARDILNFDDRLGKLQAKARLTNFEARALKDRLLALGPAFGVAKDQAIGAAETFQDFGGHLKEGQKDLQLLAQLSKATGAAMKDLAAIDVVFIEQGMQYDERVKAFAQLSAQADAAKVSLEDLARVFPELASIGAGQGFRGLRAVEQIGTALQVAGGAFSGKPQESRTAVRALLRDLTAGAGKLKTGLGIRVFDKKGMMRNLDEIMAEVVTKTGGKMSGKKGLAKFFTADSQVIASAWAGAMESGQIGKLRAARGAGRADIEEAYQKRVRGVAAEFEKVQKGLGRLDEIVQRYGSHLLAFMLQKPGTTALYAGGAYLGIKTLPKLLGWLMRGRGGGVAGGLGAGVPGAPIPVMVMNPGWGGTMPGAGGAGVVPGGAGRRRGGIGLLRKAAAVGLGAWAGWEVGKAMDYRPTLPSDVKRQRELESRTRVQRVLMGYAKGLVAKGEFAGWREGRPTFKPMTEETFMRELQRKASRFGPEGPQELANLSVQIAKLAESLKQKKPVVIQTKGGLERTDVRKGRGSQ